MENDLLNAARDILYKTRVQEDAHSGDIVRLPCHVSIDLMQASATNARSGIKQFCPIRQEKIEIDSFENEITRQLSNSGLNCKKIYIIPHAGFGKKDLADLIKDDQSNGIESKILTMTNLDFASSVQSSRQWIIDGKMMVDFGDATIHSSQCTVTNREGDVCSILEQWNNLWELSISHIDDNSDLDLQEPLVLSADLINGVASVLCTHNHVDNAGCNWYHGAWQYLRLLDMVSTPTWHHEFYTQQLHSALEFTQTPKVLITGTADYSVLAYLINSVKKLNVACDISVLDLCSTPLFTCSWYAKKHEVDIKTYQENIFEFSEVNEKSANIIVTDAFLTRFSPENTAKILSTWYRILETKGRFITTIRMHEESPATRREENAICDFKERAVKRFKRWGPYLNLSVNKLSELSETYARKMISNQLGSRKEILEEIKSSGFKILSQNAENVPGELYPTVYLRLVCEKMDK